MPAVLRASTPVCAIEIVGATHGSPAFCSRFVLANEDTVRATHASPAPVVLGCPDVGRCMHRPYGAWNSGHLRSRFCYFDTLLPLASCRKLDPLRTPRADISVGPFSLGKAVLCLGPAPAKAGGCARPARTLALRAHAARAYIFAPAPMWESGAKYPARSRKADGDATCNLGHGRYPHDNQQVICE